MADHQETDPTGAICVLTTIGDAEQAGALARRLVEDRLIACANVIPAIRSIYRWQDGIEDDAEVLIIMKTRRSRFAELEAALGEHHPYDVPEIVALPAAAVGASYLAWLQAEVPEG